MQKFFGALLQKKITSIIIMFLKYFEHVFLKQTFNCDTLHQNAFSISDVDVKNDLKKLIVFIYFFIHNNFRLNHISIKFISNFKCGSR